MVITIFVVQSIYIIVIVLSLWRKFMFKLLKRLGGTEWLMLLASVGFIVVQVWLDLKLPDYMNEITSLLQTSNVLGTPLEMAKIWENGGYMLACAVGSALSAVVVGFFSARIASSFSMSLRAEVFEKVESFSMEEMKRFSTPSLITRSTNDITQVQMVLAMGLQVMIKAPIMAVWAIVKILGKSWQWSVATAIAVVVLITTIAVVVLVTLPKFRKIQKQTDELNRITRENLQGARVVRAYNAEGYQQEKFDEANTNLTKTNLFTNRTMAIMSPVMTLIMSGLSLAIYWIGAFLINGSAMPAEQLQLFSDMVVFSSYAMQVVMAFMMLTIIFIMLPRATVSARRINEVLETKPTILDGKVETKTTLKGEVEFRNVGFKYPDADEYVLENISFTAKEGETVAFIGSTGSGKSTLINLIPRFYDATEGAVYVDGINVKEYTLYELNNKIGYIPQRAVMFSGTVKSNVSLGEKDGLKPSEEDIKKAIKVAQSTSFVEKMGGLEAKVERGGTNISGGQKQRLAIARAVARKPEIFIFDDSFSALDYKTDRKLRSVLKKETNKATCFIVAQRIGTIKDADKIIVLDEGKMVGMGTHEELMKNCKIYREIAYSQLSEEELA